MQCATEPRPGRYASMLSRVKLLEGSRRSMIEGRIHPPIPSNQAVDLERPPDTTVKYGGPQYATQACKCMHHQSSFYSPSTSRAAIR
jgi:hypothetical protein